jgi:glycosyltransferase involved in cell wall biosynthesis
MLDSSWARYGEFVPTFEKIRSLGGLVITAVYDLLPVKLPEYFVAGGSAWFEGWLQEAVRQSDALVCISRAVADEMHDYVSARPELRTQPLEIGYWHLGVDRADHQSVKADGTPADAVLKDFLSRPTLLMVGTIEPRKRHALALDAFERLWERGSQLQLLVAGKIGWMSDDLACRLRGHAEAGRRLLFAEAPDDADLACCYRQAAGLLFVSAGEGFGLPLIEGALHGLPLLATDLPVFREVAGDNAYYVNTQTPEALSDDIAAWTDLRARDAHPRSGGIKHKSWAESAGELLRVLLDNAWYRRSA